MKFLKNLSQKKLAKAVVCGLLVSGGAFAGMNQAAAASPTAYITGAEYNKEYNCWIGTGTEVKVSAESGGEAYIEGSSVRGAVGKGKAGKVTISGGKITYYVVGGGDVDGRPSEGYAIDNIVTISGGDIAGGVFGGYVYEGIAERNTVTVRGGTVSSVVGGEVMTDGTASNNTVTISGGEVKVGVIGGYVVQSGSAENNTVTISGVSIDGYVYGAYVGTGSASNNTVNLIGNDGKLGDIAGKGEIAITGVIYGGKATESIGNTLNVAGNKISAEGVEYFQNMNFYVPKTSVNGAAMLKVKSPVDLEKVESIRAIAGKGANVKEGDKITFVNGNINNFDAAKTSGRYEANDFQYYDLAYEGGAEGLTGTITSPAKFIENSNNAKSPVETQAAGMTMLNAGGDMLAGQGFANAASAVAGEVSEGGSANSLTPFMAVGGAKTKVKSGSHVDVKGWNLNVGLAKEIDNKAGKLLIGPVVEYGRGSYDSYLGNGFNGEGDTKYIGLGVMAKQTNNNGFYYEGSLRVGKLDNDYRARANSYESDATYYAAHIGLGKIVKLSEKNTLDYYGKYFYTHQKGDDTTMKTWGTDVAMHFDSVDSNRTRIGGRFTHALTERDTIYAGLAWQHEFSGTARATMQGLSTPAPSIKGNTGIMEIGWKVKAEKNLDLDFSAIGYTGKQKGAGVNVAMNFKF